MVYFIGDSILMEEIATIIILCLTVLPILVALFLMEPFMGFVALGVMALFWPDV